MPSPENLAAKTGEFYRNLRGLFDSERGSPLSDYVGQLANACDYADRFRDEQKKLGRLSESQLGRQREAAKFALDASTDYCEHCKTSFWPSNCAVFVAPKSAVSVRAAKLYARHRLLAFQPRHGSYQDRQLRNISRRGLKLVYECRRCRARNVVLRETGREAGLRLIAARGRKVQAKTRPAPVQVAPAAAPLKAFAAKKKFMSLQTMLKRSEQQEEQMRAQKSQTSLSDFLQKLS